jgi:hypothetical protein
MASRAQGALERHGIDERVEAAAIFFPRGHFRRASAGGLIGGELAGSRTGARPPISPAWAHAARPAG